MQGGQVLAQFAVVVVYGEERIGQGSWGGGRNAEVGKGSCCSGGGEEVD
jgi:hypothetical protein